MTIKQFIEAAIEGGYPDVLALSSGAFGIHQSQLVGIVKSMVLEPRAWKAVGKVKGWGNKTSRVCICGMCRIPDEQADRIVWEEQMAQHQMHMMVMNLCNGKTLEEHIATL